MSAQPASSGEAGPSSGGVADLVSKVEQLGHDADGDDHSGSEDEGDEAPADGAADTSAGAKKKKNKKKKKSKSKAADKSVDEAQSDLLHIVRDNMNPAESSRVSDQDIRKALKAVDLMKLLEMASGGGKEPVIAEHKFWKTQPVPQQNVAGAGSDSTEGPIDPPKTVDEVKQEPYGLPAGFEWSTIDVKDDAQMLEVHTLLTENYVEDDDAMFRFRYSKEFLLWALTPPGYFAEWHIGVRVQKTGKLIAFISGINVEVRCRSNTFDAAEINFLCVHKKLRSKRLAPVLIKEVTRRVNLTNIWQAVYTAGVVLPTPFSTCRYYHRNLNPPKLVDIGFSPLPRGSTIARLVKQYAVPTAPKIPGFREMVAADVPQVAALLRSYLARYEIMQTFSRDDDVEHWFISGRGTEENGQRVGQVVWAYVVEDSETNKITDVISFYSLPSTIMQHPKHDVLNAAYMYYYASDVGVGEGASKTKLAERLNALVGDLLIVAKQSGFDVLNALSLMDNNTFLQPQQFGAGDGLLNYYLYNWSTAAIDGGKDTTAKRQGSQLGVVML